MSTEELVRNLYQILATDPWTQVSCLLINPTRSFKTDLALRQLMWCYTAWLWFSEGCPLFCRSNTWILDTSGRRSLHHSSLPSVAFWELTSFELSAIDFVTASAFTEPLWPCPSQKHVHWLWIWRDRWGFFEDLTACFTGHDRCLKCTAAHRRRTRTTEMSCVYIYIYTHTYNIIQHLFS